MIDLLHSRLSVRQTPIYTLIAVFAALFGFAVFAYAIHLHSLSEPYSFFTHFVSSLGFGPNGSHEVFKYGLIILGALLVPFVLFLTVYIDTHGNPDQKHITRRQLYIGIVMFAVSYAGLILLSIFSQVRDADFVMHVIGAPIYFLFSLYSVLWFTWIMRREGLSSHWQSFVALLVLGMFVGFLLSTSALAELEDEFGGIFLETRLLYDMDGEARLLLVRRMIEQAPWMGFFEWMVVLITLAWFVVTAFTVQRHHKEKQGIAYD